MELKPCPFCGETVAPRLTSYGYIWCDNGCKTAFNTTDEIFNTRPIEDALLEAAKAGLEYVRTSCGQVVRKQRLKEQLSSAIEQAEGSNHE